MPPWSYPPWDGKVANPLSLSFTLPPSFFLSLSPCFFFALSLFLPPFFFLSLSFSLSLPSPSFYPNPKLTLSLSHPIPPSPTNGDHRTSVLPGLIACFYYFAALPPLVWIPLWLLFLSRKSKVGAIQVVVIVITLGATNPRNTSSQYILAMHPLNTSSNISSHYILSIHPLNPTSQYIFASYLLKPPSQHILSTHPLNTSSQHTSSTHPLNTPPQHTSSTHPLNVLTHIRSILTG